MRIGSLSAGVVVLALSGVYARADPVTYSFENISANSVADAAIGEAQLFVTVSDAGAGQVLFTFFNTGPLASSITDVYFDDGTLLGIASVNNTTGVSFSQGASPPELPAGNNASPPFETTAGFLADSDPPAESNGVNPGESLGILFNLQGGGMFADVLAELATGELRIGIHVQGFASGGSESFINNGPTNGVPEPGLAVLAVFGIAGCFLARRRS